MPTHYVEDYDGERNKDADPVRPESVEATPVEGEAEVKIVKSTKVEDKAIKSAESKKKS
jgi:hypothetical protein